MTTQPPEGDLAAQAEALTAEVAGLRRDVGAVRTDNRRLRSVVRRVTLALVAVGILAIVVALVAVDSQRSSSRAEHAVSVANRTAENQRLSCEIGNESRAVQRQLWNYVLDLSSANRRLNPAQRRQVMQFRAYVAKTFAPRDCSSPNATVRPPTSTPTR